ncbi:flagellar motor protein MotB [Magnetospirillum sulfuroxidans]|uniref:Flagellar motor protein MotB n=1 Tax=Magnetospirillum sulfuroxidans TaxID=611300 RepID=A0ABS5I7Y1_9PROT|nr:flagellar motor protein MotB [Magnetospirillum sulfuroxidans]MBR9970524.1 flagellar motor protein MotB [Magnetospirillum sulfuroxidans]
MAEGQQIIIKRVKKVAGGHHGGAWKVAYADFVTAMMAFFLLLWLLNAVTEEQLTGISNYFAPSMASKSASGAGGLLGGQVIGEGAQVSMTSSPSLVQHLPPSSIGPGGEDMTSAATEPMEGMSEEDFREKLAEREQQKFDKAKEVLDNALKGIPELKQYQGSMMVDNTPEGLRIQITDQEGLAMFPSGSSAMFGHTKALLDLVSRIVNQMPNKISITGHTDAIPFRDPSGYTNWELSADRALASRRALLASGVPEERIDRIVGRASSEPLVQDDPKAPRNRRISIILLRENDLTSPPEVPTPAPTQGPAPTPPAGPNTGNDGKKG